MEYTNLFEPLILIFICLLLGLLIGSLITFWIYSKNEKKLENENDKFRELYFEERKRWENKYTNNDYEAY